MKAGLMQQIEQALKLVGGVTESIFPQVETLLLSGKGYDEALKYVATRKKIDRYHSVVDFLFCELHPEWKISCRRFYTGNGSMLRDQITMEQIAEYADRLLVALHLARKLFDAEMRNVNWISFRKQVSMEIQRKAA